MQCVLSQSAPIRQALVTAHLVAQSPPQSMSVSLPFFTPSLQVGTAHAPAVHTPLAQRLKLGEVIHQLIRRQWDTPFFREMSRWLFGNFVDMLKAGGRDDTPLEIKCSALGIAGILYRAYAVDLLSQLPGVLEILLPPAEQEAAGGVPMELQRARIVALGDVVTGIHSGNLMPQADKDAMSRIYAHLLATVGSTDPVLSAHALELLLLLNI